jgi:hypothetical protein
MNTLEKIDPKLRAELKKKHPKLTDSELDDLARLWGPQARSVAEDLTKNRTDSGTDSPGTADGAYRYDATDPQSADYLAGQYDASPEGKLHRRLFGERTDADSAAAEERMQARVANAWKTRSQ